MRQAVRGAGRFRVGRRTISGLLAAAAVGATLLGLAPARQGAGAATAARVTRGDLREERSRVARLEADYALSSARQPYVVLDVKERRLLYRLVGMTLREVPLDGVEIHGLRPAAEEPAPAPPQMAGIFSLGEKEGDPRLSPLTPEQIEAGLDDEDAVDALPPDPPTEFSLAFKQPVTIRVAGSPSGASVASGWAALRGFASSLLRIRRGAAERAAAIHVTLRVDEATAREIYRSLVPQERWLLVPPPGLVLPPAGQEPLPRPRPPRQVPPPAPPPPKPGVPFQIPPPVEGDQPGAGQGPPAPDAIPQGPPDAPPQAEPGDDSPTPEPEPAEDEAPATPTGRGAPEGGARR